MLAEYAAMIAVSSVAVTLWLGGWMRPFPQILSGQPWELVFSLFPAMSFFVLALMAAVGTVRMPKHPLFRKQTLGLAGFAAVLALIGVVLLLPPVRSRVQDIYWFSLKIAVFMYLYIWYRGTFPRYRFDQLMQVGWKVMIPLSLGALILTALVGVAPELTPVLRQWMAR
jgi:NADH-quinone oxidoreductase subunit H